MKIDVTQQHIECGDIGLPRECPIALAVKDALDEHDVSVGYETVVVAGELFFLPEQASLFIYDLCHNQPVSPFSFELGCSGKKD